MSGDVREGLFRGKSLLTVTTTILTGATVGGDALLEAVRTGYEGLIIR